MTLWLIVLSLSYQKKLSRQINKGTLDLNKRINELFDLAKGEIGMITLRQQEIFLDKILNGIIHFYMPDAERKHISLVADFPSMIGPAWGDHQRITQVLNNLMVNALKYTNENGKITLKARYNNGEYVIEVKDTGCGIPPHKLGGVFLPYNRQSQNENSGGMCLGLALSKMFVEMHGGKIWVQSEEGKGSNFGFTLPAIKKELDKDIL